MWPLEHTQGFSKIWPSELVFDPTWTPFEIVQEFIKKNIMTRLHDHQTENLAAIEYTRQKVGDRQRTMDRHSTITIAHYEHFVLRWAKNNMFTLYQTTKFFTNPNWEQLQTGDWKIAICTGKGRKHCGEKEKMLVTSIFSSSHNVFKTVCVTTSLKVGIVWERVKLNHIWKLYQFMANALIFQVKFVTYRQC